MKKIHPLDKFILSLKALVSLTTLAPKIAISYLNLGHINVLLPFYKNQNNILQHLGSPDAVLL